MKGLIYCSNEFCPNLGFLNKVLNILCDSGGIFKATTKQVLLDVYNDMRNCLNNPSYIIYPLSSNYLGNKVNTKALHDVNNKFSVGHDIPVWLNDPGKANHRILILSQDPRRNKKEMIDMEIGLSTPFAYIL